MRQFIYRHWTLLLAIFLSSFLGELNVATAQTSNSVVATNTNGVPTDAFSPSVTSLKSGSSEVVVSAYSYIASSHCKVAVSRSTDNGSTWQTPITLTLPTWSGSSLTDMDDAQILSTTGNNMVLVVRSWDNNTSNVKGVPLASRPDQPGTIFKKSGIYLCVSTNQGQTWGYWASNGTFQQNTWQTVEQNDNYTSTHDHISIEHPRIAYRNGYDNKGYIVWQRRTLHNEDYEYSQGEETFLGVLYGYTERYVVMSNELGITCFDDGSVLGKVGKLYNVTSFSPSTTKFYFADATLSSAPNPPSNFPDYIKGPEKPSVAISPDKRIWLGYFVTQYDIDDHDKDDNDLVMSGDQPPPAAYFIASHPGTTSGSGTSTTITFSNSSVDRRVVDVKTLPGLYSCQRGYWYLRDFNSHFYNGDGQGNSPATATIANNDAGFEIDATEGPSVQVTCDNPLVCSPSYHVGMVYVVGQDNFWTQGSSFVAPTPRTKLKFWSAKVPSELPSTYLPSNSAQLVVKYWLDNRDQTSADEIETSSSTDQNIRLFPVLKYVNVEDQFLNAKPTDGSSSFPKSYFAIAYMSALRSSGHTGPQLDDYAVCRTGIAFNNTSFKITNHSTTPVTTDFIRQAEATSAISATVSTGKWGSKIDICGEFGNFTVHPVWHPLKASTATEALQTNLGSAILVQSYVTPALPNDPSALQSDVNLFKENATGAVSTTSAATAAPFAYYNFNNIGRPTSTTGGQVSIAPVTGTVLINSKACIFSQFHPSLSSGALASGLYYGEYNNQVKLAFDGTFGVTGWNNQRKFVQTGKVLHSVYERPGTTPNNTTTFYAMNAGGTSLNGQWVEKTGLLDPPPTGFCQTNPSIGVYEEKDASGLTGKGAIGVSWVEWKQIGSNSPTEPYFEIHIKFRTREFNYCNGTWGNWSDPEDVYKFVLFHNEDEAGQDGNEYPPIPMVNKMYPIYPTVLPFTTPKSTSRPTTETNLLGWTISWNGTDVIGKCGTIPNSGGADYTSFDFMKTGFLGATKPPALYKIYSRVWLRNNGGTVLTDNSSWTTLPTSTKWEPSSSNNIVFSTNVNSLDKQNDAMETDNLTGASLENNFLQEDIGYFYRASGKPNIFGNTFAMTGSHGVFNIDAVYARVPQTGVSIGQFLTSRTSDPGGLRATRIFPLVKDIADYEPSIVTNSNGKKFIAVRTEDSRGATFRVNRLSRSSITIAESFLPGKGDITTRDWTSKGIAKAVKQYTYPYCVVDWKNHWFKGPSLTAVPKSLNVNDKAGVELSFWQQDAANGPLTGFTPLNMRFLAKYQETKGTETMGTWSITSSSGMWPHMSYSDYRGTQFNGTGGAYCINNTASDLPGPLRTFQGAQLGAYKGTYTEPVLGELYRNETRIKDTGSVTFSWGAVYVGDTSVAPLRHVKFYMDQDTDGYDNYPQMRDSFFRTETFDIGPGERVHYWRGVLGGITNLADSTVDSIFIDPAFHVKYTMELVHELTNQVDTLEQVTFSPFEHKYISNLQMHTLYDNIYEDVYLRVRGDFAGLVDTCTAIQFADDQVFGTNPIDGDSTLAVFKISGRVGAIGKDRLNVLAPYPNPTYGGGKNIEFLAAYTEGFEIRTQLYDLLGKAVSSSIATNSTGNWQSIKLSAPQAPGVYNIRITAGSEVKNMPFTVVR